MYFNENGLLRRADLDLMCGEMNPSAIYCSAHRSFSGLTLPTLHGGVMRDAAVGASKKTSLLVIEIFGATFG